MTNQKKLLKEWSEADFKRYQQKAGARLHDAMMYQIFNFTAGKKPFESCAGWNFERLENLFGLPYVSAGSEFAGLWNTNTQAEATIKNKIYYFRCLAITEAGGVVFALNDKKENYIFLTFEELKREIKAQAAEDYAKQLEQAAKEAEKIGEEVTEILRRYAGKKFGEKTRAAIYEEIRKAASKHGDGFRVYLNGGTNPNWQSIQIDKYITGRIHGYKNFNIYGFEWIDEATNTIKSPELKPQEKDKEPTQAHREQKALKIKIKRLCDALLPLINEYNHNNNILQVEDRYTQNDTSINVYSLAKYGFDD